jgi:hypothetical protein
MSAAASQRVALFTASHVVPRIEETYEEVLRAGPLAA